MHIVVCKDYEEMSRRAAEIVAEQIKKRPDGLISFPGGDTPLGMVHVFADMVNEGKVDIDVYKRQGSSLASSSYTAKTDAGGVSLEPRP